MSSCESITLKCPKLPTQICKTMFITVVIYFIMHQKHPELKDKMALAQSVK
jgi:hypothetical protein